MNHREFKDDEERYQAWLRLHPDGFVLNMRKTPSERYVVLHRATCSSISAYTRKTPRGAFYGTRLHKGLRRGRGELEGMDSIAVRS